MSTPQRQSDPGTTLALADYDPRQYIVLQPSTLVQEDTLSPALKSTVSVVLIDTSNGSPDTYSDYLFANETKGMCALTAHGLQRIAQAAGIVFHPSLSGKVSEKDFPGGHRRVEWRAVGGVRQPNGEMVWITKSKEVDTQSALDKYEMTIRDRAKREKKTIDEEELNWQLRKRLIEIKEHLTSNAETKAQLRVVRALLGLKQSYSKAELAKPFVVPRLVLRPDLADPRELDAIRIEGARSTAALYGGSGASSSGDVRGDAPGSAPERSSGPALPSGPGQDGPGASATATATDAGGGGGTSSSRQKPSEASAPGPTNDAPSEPASDPMIQYKGSEERLSYVTELDPGFVRGVIAETRNKTRRDLYQAWLDYFQPRLG